jgi:putative tricarboxylic transport membrane protein
VFDVYSVAVLGLLAYGLIQARIPLTPIILGLVLGPALEREFRTALILSRGEADIFISSVPSALFLGLAALVVGGQILRSLRGILAARKAETPSHASADTEPRP